MTVKEDVLNKLARAIHIWEWRTVKRHHIFTNEQAKEMIENAVDIAFEAERERVRKAIADAEIDILGQFAYQGADIPKKFLKEEVPKQQGWNDALKELKKRLLESEKK